MNTLRDMRKRVAQTIARLRWRSRLRKALQHVQKLVARHAPYSELMAALDACDQLPRADKIRSPVQRYRLIVMGLYGRPENEVERELLAFHHVEPDLYTRALATIGACADSVSLAGKYLPPVIKELEAAMTESPAKGRGKATGSRQCAECGGSRM